MSREVAELFPNAHRARHYGTPPPPVSPPPTNPAPHRGLMPAPASRAEQPEWADAADDPFIDPLEDLGDDPRGRRRSRGKGLVAALTFRTA